MSLVTPAGLEKLNTELQLLRSKRAAVIEGIRAGQTGMADRATAEEYLAAHERLAQLGRQIGVLEDRLVSAKVIQADPADGELGIGESVRVRDLDSGELVEYRIVGAGEADPDAGSISYLSPVGSALLGRQTGDVIEVNTPRGILRFEVREIQL